MTLPVIEPIIPRLARELPVGRSWRYEVKLDGFRGTLYIDRGRAQFRSKSVRVMKRFQSLADGLARALDLRDAILDGEIIVMARHTPDFYALMFRRGQPEYAAFDLMWLNGRDLRRRSYTERKNLLRTTLKGSQAIGYVEHYTTPDLFEAAAQLDLEGVVAKRSGDPYAQTTDWLKVKYAGYSQWEGRHELFDRLR